MTKIETQIDEILTKAMSDINALTEAKPEPVKGTRWKPEMHCKYWYTDQSGCEAWSFSGDNAATCRETCTAQKKTRKPYCA